MGPARLRRRRTDPRMDARGEAGSVARASSMISVVMSVFNGASTLAETIDSVLAQEGVDFEFVIVDDGSTDDSGRIADAYAERDPRVRVIHQPNAGLTRALIVGCAAARGESIARQDAGDISHPRRLLVQKQALDADAGVAFVSCVTQFAGPELEPLYLARPQGAAFRPAFGLDPSLPRGMTDGPTSHPSVMFRRDACLRAGGYRAAFYYGQDFDLWYRLAAIGKFQAIDEVLYTARVTPDSISSAARAPQMRIAQLSLAALRARSRGESDEAILAEVALIRPKRDGGRRRRRAEGLYFIGEALRRNGDRRAQRY